MVEIVIDNLIRVRRCSQINSLIPTIKSMFTHSNPLFFKVRAMGYNTRNIPSKIESFWITDDYILLPRGYYYQLLNLLKESNIQFKIINKMTQCEKISVGLQACVESRAYQLKAIEQLKANAQQILLGPTASGKTIIILQLIAQIKQPTIIITQRAMLFKQWIDEINTYMKLDFKVGQIGNGHFNIKPITLAMMQTLFRLDNNDWKKINSSFGMMVNEETHHVPALENFKVINRFKCKHRYGITATLKRKDQLEFLTYATLGRGIVKIDDADPDVQGKRIKPSLEFIYDRNINSTDEDGQDDLANMSWQEMINVLIENEQRNKHILQEVEKDLADNHSVIVLSDRVNHCLELYNKFPNKTIARPFVGTLDEKLKDKIKIATRIGKIRVIFATKNIASEGLDIPLLAALHLVTPSNNEGLLKQMVGRVSRKADGKEVAIVKDYVDMNSSYLSALAKKRFRYYKKMGVNLREAANAEPLYQKKDPGL